MRILVMLLLLAAAAQADLVATFDKPIEQTILGVDGWEPRMTGALNPDSARVMPLRWDGGKPGLMLRQASIKNAFKPTTSERVKVTLQMAVNFSDETPAGKQARIGFHGNPFGEVFFDQGKEGGLGYQADSSGKDGVVVLKRNEVKPNSFYTYVAVADFAKQKFDITITGVKKDGTPFEHKAEGVSFESKLKHIGLVYIITTQRVTTYLRSLVVESLP